MVKKWFSPMKEIPNAAAMRLGISSFILLLLVWSLMTYGGFIKPLFLPTPGKVLTTFIGLLKDGSIFPDIWASFARVLYGFILAAIIAIPLGMFMGSLRSV